MSQINGDKARSNLARKKRAAQRERNRKLRATLKGTPPAGKASKAAS